jgi:glycosyltransferase involved in cell wall biosynthesis
MSAPLSREVVVHPASHPLPSVGMLSTFPPTACGLATFAAALAGGLRVVGVDQIGVVRVSDGAMASSDPAVVAHLRSGSPASQRAAQHALGQFDCAIVQHEFGIFGGGDGEEVLDVMSGLSIPAITTLHTVPLRPTARQRHVLEAVVHLSAAAVTMTEVARARLFSRYDVDPRKVSTIPHGATLPIGALHPAGSAVARTAPPTVLTWGLIGPGKGIEHAIEAMVHVRRLVPSARYVVAGRTHPKVLARDGESYRASLVRKVHDLGLAGAVEFDDRYRGVDEVVRMAADAACVVLPYDSTDQTTSGVLVDAVAAGRPIVATEFPHAVELLGRGCGIVVPHRSPASLAAAIAHVLTRPSDARLMELAAHEVALEHHWPAVAAAYARLSLQVQPVEAAPCG